MDRDLNEVISTVVKNIASEMRNIMSIVGNMMRDPAKAINDMITIGMNVFQKTLDNEIIGSILMFLEFLEIDF